MKKILFIVPIALLFLTGCGSESYTKTVCTNTVDINESTTLAAEYSIYAEGDIVHILSSTEALKSDDKELLDDYKQKLSEVYGVYSQVPYYFNAIFEEEGYLTSITTVNYFKVNTDDLIKIDENNANIISDGIVSLSVLRELYESNGAVCSR